MSPPYISFIVCGNGYGHLKRVLNISGELLLKSSRVHIHLFCSGWHIDSAKSFPNFQGKNLSERVSFDNSLSRNEINWLKKDGVNYDSYEKWLSDIKENEKLQQSNMIVSDNHVAVLNIFPKSFLMGSFLWHDVFENTSSDSEINAIIKREKQLISELKPSMICLKDMAMDAVLEQTRPYTIPWICEKSSGRKLRNSGEQIKKILVTGGGTELMNNYLAKLAIELSLNPFLEVFCDSALYRLEPVKKSGIPLFSFEKNEFVAIDLLICRPGIGIITDAINYNIPLCTVNDFTNKEINHNASRVEELGIGASLKMDEVFTNVQKITELIYDDEWIQECIISLETRETGGASVAAEYLLTNL